MVDDPYRTPPAVAVRLATDLNRRLDDVVTPGGNATAILVLALAMRMAEQAGTAARLHHSHQSIAQSLRDAAYHFQEKGRPNDSP